MDKSPFINMTYCPTAESSSSDNISQKETSFTEQADSETKESLQGSSDLQDTDSRTLIAYFTGRII